MPEHAWCCRGYEFGEYVSFYWVAGFFGASFYLHAFSAVLSWIKLFKFFTFFPEMYIFTKTLSLSTKQLSIFVLVVVIVMTGSAQGFCLAFGTDISGFRNPLQALVSIALFTVGKFDYDELVHSQRFLGPFLFWVYIFLVFFVLMSVFIAILSEGYEAAKSAIPATSTGHLGESIQTLLMSNYEDIKSGSKRAFQRMRGKRQEETQKKWKIGLNRARTSAMMSMMTRSADEEDQETVRIVSHYQFFSVLEN
eukprot:SAG31_NODE_888_length_11219_cov_5.584712_10_plen_251_part_00